jgi:type IV pilus assembly protein PilC
VERPTGFDPMEFRCRLGTPNGEVVEGVYVAESEARLRRDLEERGLFILGIRRAGWTWRALQLSQRRKVSQTEFLVFNQELATLLRAGMPLVQSLDILRKRVENAVFRAVLDDIHERVRAGHSLSEAFEAQGSLFPGVYHASLMAGEKSGSLEQVIRRYVSYVKVISNVRRKTLSALIYPAILVVLSLIVVSIILFRVVPEFAGFYGQFGRELPLVTRLIVGFSGFVVRWFPLIAGVLVAGAIGVWTWIRRPTQRARLDQVLLSLPIAGPTIRRFAASQAGRTLSTLLSGGIPLVNALGVTARAVGNQHMARELGVIEQQVREGRSLASAMADRGVFPDVAVRMVEVGESTGALQDMLSSLADFFDEENDTKLGRFVTMVEPLLLVFMGLVIAGLLLALYMPLFQLSSVIS